MASLSEPDSLLEDLRALEIALHQPGIRADRSRLAVLLHDDFVEIGRSGATFSKEDVITHLVAGRDDDATIIADGFLVRRIADHVALLTYRSARTRANGEYEAFTLRSSLWQRSHLGWQMRFHQGTPTAAFELPPQGTARVKAVRGVSRCRDT
jgi:hypothetical protein